MTARSDMVFVAGNIFPGNRLVPRPAYLGRFRQDSAGRLSPLTPLALPPGGFQFAYPRILAVGDDLHLVWGEFMTAPSTVEAWTAVSNPVTSLWHAAFRHGVWSAPKEIAASRWFGWNNDNGGIASDRNGTLHVAVWSGELGQVQDFRFIGGEWEDSPLPYSGLNQTVAITAHGDSVDIGLIDERADTARVLIVASSAASARWGRPIVASWRPRQHGSVSRLAFASSTAGLLLAIGEKGNDSFFLDTIRLVRIQRDSRPAVTHFIAPPKSVDDFELALAPCGAAVMVLRTFSTTPELYQLTMPMVPSDSFSTAVHPLLASAAIAMFPGLTAGRSSAIATFGYTTAPNERWQNVAMTLPVCSP